MSTINPRISVIDIASIVACFYAARRTPLFIGRPGCGKTALVRAAAAALTMQYGEHVDVVELHLASMSEVDVRGYLIPVGDHAVFTKPSFWTHVERHPRGILFLDEFVQAPHEVQKAVAPLILEGTIGDYKLPPGWSVVLAGNGLEDNAGANTLLSHVLNRVTRFEVGAADPDHWAMWAINAGLEPEIIAFAKLRPNVAFESDIPDGADTPWCTPRSMHALSDVAKCWPGGLRAMAADTSGLGLAVMAGSIGTGAAAELASVVKTAINLPDFEEMMASPDTTRIPKELSEQYAAVMLVAVRATAAKHGEAAVKYLRRFNPNIALTGLVALINKDKSFTMSQAMGQWVRDNRELLGKFHQFIQITKA